MRSKIQDNAGILCFPWGLPTSPLLGLMINPGTWSEEELLSHDLRLGLHPTHLCPPVSPLPPSLTSGQSCTRYWGHRRQGLNSACKMESGEDFLAEYHIYRGESAFIMCLRYTNSKLPRLSHIGHALYHKPLGMESL